MVKFLVMDVDGTLTDGKLHISETGELFKSFNVKDGCGIKDVLPKYGIVPIVLTARNSKILQIRCKELGIEQLHQGVRIKQNILKEIINSYNKENSSIYGLNDCAYIGDDIIDLECMIAIKSAGGAVGCPKDAVKKVIEIADYIAEHNGGEGAVRDFIEWIVCERNIK